MKTTKKITNKDVGAQLRKAREKHGVSIEEAARTLHIPLQQIEALENNTSAEVFSAPVYAFGALRSYSSWLGLDTQALERVLAQQLKNADASRSTLRVHTVARWHTRLLHPNAVVGIAGAIVAIAVGSYVMWQIRSFWRLPSVEITRPQESIIREDTVTVIGATEEGATIRINGEPTPLQDGHTFEKEIALLPGITIIRVEAENVAGRVKTTEKHILRPRTESSE